MRYFGADIITAVKTIATNNLNPMLEIIKVERGDTGLETIRKINVGIVERQYPECVINLQDSILVEEELTLDLLNTPEVFPVEVLIVMKDNTDLIALRVEYYIEALQRIFNGYTDSKISWISVKNSIRADAYTEQKETLKVAGILIDVRIL